MPKMAQQLQLLLFYCLSRVPGTFQVCGCCFLPAAAVPATGIRFCLDMLFSAEILEIRRSSTVYYCCVFDRRTRRSIIPPGFLRG